MGSIGLQGLQLLQHPFGMAQKVQPVLGARLMLRSCAASQVRTSWFSRTWINSYSQSRAQRAILELSSMSRIPSPDSSACSNLGMIRF